MSSILRKQLNEIDVKSKIRESF